MVWLALQHITSGVSLYVLVKRFIFKGTISLLFDMQFVHVIFLPKNKLFIG